MVTYPLSRLVSYTDLENMPSQHLYQVNYKRSGYYLVRLLEVIM
ncbi:Uncharacterised protein [Escherichia coli]|nr:Uncharacterised protein [Escherichia coli]STN76225.1 Uncharacterised protein [Escherichia coli]